MTALGPVSLRRAYQVSPTTGGRYPADETLGVDGALTRQATRLVTLVGVEHAFARAATVLQALCGWTVGEETVRRTTHAEAKRAQSARSRRGDARRFHAADGVVETQIDAGKVNTRDGWRDVKLAINLRRIPGEPMDATSWDKRTLPAPTIRSVIAAVEDRDAFAGRLRTETDRLGVTEDDDVTVLGDGADWVWSLAAEVLPQAEGVLDVFHALEHLSDALATVFGEGTETTTTHWEAGRTALFDADPTAFDRWLGPVIAAVPADRSTDPLLHLAAYLAKHPTRRAYAARLAEGRSIGSGAVEGTIKQLLNLRLKRTGARWRPDHVGPLIELRALVTTDDWDPLWSAA